MVSFIAGACGEGAQSEPREAPPAASPPVRPAPSSAPATRPAGSPGRKLLDVRLPGAAKPGAASARAVVRYGTYEMEDSAIEGVRLQAGDEAPRELALGFTVAVELPAARDTMYQFQVGPSTVLAPLRPGETLLIHDRHDGGWVAEIAERQLHNAGQAQTRCGVRAGACPRGYLEETVHDGDSVCSARREGEVKCIQAPLIRARGPMPADATVAEASTSGQFDDVGAVPIAPKGLAAGAVGPPIPVAIGGERMPLVRAGKASAFLLMGPGETWEVGLARDGTIEATLVADNRH